MTADIASKRTPGPRTKWGQAMLDSMGFRGDAERLRAITFVLAIEDEAANTYDELLAVAEAAQPVVDEAEPDDDFEGQYVEWLVPYRTIEKLRAALAALDAAREKEGHRE